MPESSELTIPAPPVDHDTDVACICGSRRVSLWGDCRRSVVRSVGGQEGERLGAIEPGRLYRCDDCKLGFRYPQPSEEKLAALYRTMSSDRWQEDAGESHAWRRSWQILDFKNSPPKRILDVGAFTGGFLAGVPKSWSRSAIEPSTDARKRLTESGIDVVADLLQSPGEELRRRFDVVTMFDVFEHLPDPLQGLQDLKSITRPGGRIILSTGNMDHWTWKLLGGEHWYLDPMQHLCFGSVCFFTRWANENGFALRHLESIPHGNRSPANVLQQSLCSLYFGCRRRNGLGAKFGRRILPWLPSLRQLKHKRYSPYTRSLRDHVLVVMEVVDPTPDRRTVG